MSTLKGIVSESYRISEVELGRLAAPLDMVNIEVLEVPESGQEVNEVWAVDSGFTTVSYLGLLIGLIHAVALKVPGMARRTIVKSAVINNDDELAHLARNIEAELALSLPISKGAVIMVDGPLSSLDQGILSQLIDKVKAMNGYLMSFTKDSRSLKAGIEGYESVSGQALAMVAFNKYRVKKGSTNRPLVTKPARVMGGLVSFYMQHTPAAPPIYIEASDNVLNNLGILNGVLRMMSREGYPLPLYVADKLAKLSSSLRGWFTLSLVRLSSGEVEPLVYRYVRDLLGLGRGRRL